MNINNLIKYIDDAFNNRSHLSAYWVDENGNDIGADVGYAWEWWQDCMKPELIRVFGDKKDY